MKKGLFTLFLALGAPVMATAPARAQDVPEYVDDRSGARELIGSYFNALNRHEFSRAWSYWDGGVPGMDFSAFEFRYAEVTRIRVRLGTTVSEGAVGSIYTQVPLAIEMQMESGEARVAAGCFVLRISNPQIQGVPFKPLHIERGALAQLDGASLKETVPGPCDF
ncbi:MAG TPA: hypothetical protein ENJ68_02945 [Devosia sp.]|nr:hypothetical protein [Devosia sp.]